MKDGAVVGDEVNAQQILAAPRPEYTKRTLRKAPKRWMAAAA